MKYPFVLLGLSGSYQSTGEITAKMNTSFSVSRDPNVGRINLSSTDVGRTGMAAVQIFLDKDLDGTFSSGDTPLEGVGFKYASGGTIKGKTNVHGSMLITGLPA